MIINLTDLVATRGSTADHRLVHHQREARDGVIAADYILYENGDSIAFGADGSDADVSTRFAAALVAEHNAIGVLIEVARTGLDWDAAEDVLHKASGIRTRLLAAEDAARAYETHRAALAKVSL